MPDKKAAQAQPNSLLRRARQERGWSQQEVADLVGAPHAYMVTRWESGTAFPGPGYRERLCALFGKSHQELGLFKVKAKEALPADLQSPLFDPTIPLRLSQASTLVGRCQVLAQLKEHFSNAEPGRLIAIDGLPGVGKTRLAAELATSSEVWTNFRDGVLWVGLGPQPNIQAHLRRWCALVG